MLANPFIVGPALAWIVAHSLKLIISAVQGEFDWAHIYSSGGFPSGHTSIVTALATVSIIELGWSAPLTGVSVVLMAIVIYDAQGVRRAAEVLAAQVSQLSRDTQVKLDLPITTARGHTIAEIMGGILTGALMALMTTVLLA